MTRPRSPIASTCYRIRVDGHLDADWSPWFAGLSLTPDADGTTTLTGVVADQAQLHGLLAKVRDLGLTLLSVQVCAATDSPSPPGAAPTAAPGPKPQGQATTSSGGT